MSAKSDWMKVFGHILAEIDEVKSHLRQTGDGSAPIIKKLDDIEVDVERLFDEKVAEWAHLEVDE